MNSSKPRILMFHGKEGSPQGRKSRFLKSCSQYEVCVPAYPSNAGPVTEVFPQCLSIARTTLDQFQPDLVIGSSFGGGILLKLITEKLEKTLRKLPRGHQETLQGDLCLQGLRSALDARS